MGPAPDRPWHRPLWAGGRGDPGQRPDPGLLAIDVDQVTEALADLPPAAAPAPRRRAAARGRVAWPWSDGQGERRVAAAVGRREAGEDAARDLLDPATPSTMLSRRRWR